MFREKLQAVFAPFWKSERVSPARVIILGFLLLILLGTALLMLPFSTKARGGASFSDALFTATSATCVTGLVVRDTASCWSGFGQLVILLLIQVGGMGVVTMAVAIFIFSGKRIGLKQRWVMQESISAPQVGGIVRMTGFILKTAFAMEGIGAAILALRFCPRFGLWRGLWYSVFHSVSAFCNAGFDLMGVRGEFSSLTSYAAEPVINVTVMLLILIGGIGFLTWDDIRSNRLHVRRYRMQSKVILCATGLLLLLPALYFYVFEFGALPPKERILASLFQTVTPRTAGFNTVELTKLSDAGQSITVALMLTGGSPGSTAGGMKTTTVAVLFAATISTFQREEYPHFFRRRIDDDAVKNAATILLMYLTLFFFGGLIISVSEGLPMLTCLFEAASAVGTVGLTLGITPGLGTLSRLILIMLRFFGRVGGLTLIFAALSGRQKNGSKYPHEKVTVG